MLKELHEDYCGSGTINETLKIDSNYNDLLYIEDGEIVYISSEASNMEKEWLEKLDIEPMSDYFTITFETSGGTQILPQTIKSGKKLKEPTSPLKNNYDFLYWYYYMNNGTEEKPNYEEVQFDFSQAIYQNYTLYAKYEGEAMITSTDSNGEKYFWKYRDKITSISFLKVNSIIIPETAVDYWEHIERNSEYTQISAYIEYDDTGSTYKLSIVSTKNIFAHPYSDFLFYNFTQLKNIDFTNYDTSKCVSMACMFSECANLQQLNNFKFVTSHVKYMQQMFYHCKKLNTLDISSFDTSNVKLMQYMFSGCENLTSLDISKFTTTNVTNMQGMFQNMLNVTSLNISNFDTEKVTNMSYMFAGSKLINYLDFRQFNTENVIDMSYMFQECSSLQNLDLSNFKTKNVKNMTYMFYLCSNLNNLNLSNFYTENVENMSRMFSYCSKLNTEITINTSNSIEYTKIFNSTSTAPDSKVIVNYTSETSSLVDNMILTKSTNSNVIKGSLVN